MIWIMIMLMPMTIIAISMYYLIKILWKNKRMSYQLNIFEYKEEEI